MFSKRSAIRRVGSSKLGFCFLTLRLALLRWLVNSSGRGQPWKTRFMRPLERHSRLKFQDKTNILRTLVDIAPGLPAEEKAELNKSLRELADYSASRNMIAHDPFRPNSAATGVEFLTVKAKGRFELPSVVWNADRFQQEGATVDQYRALLDGLRDRFRIRPLGPESFVQDHMPWMIPMQRTMSPVLMHYLFHQAQDDPGSDPAMQGTNAQTPEEPERKE
jgi:hypothetical protein